MQNLAALSALSFVVASTAHGQLFSEPFDDSAADVTIIQQPDSVATFVNYANMTVGTTNFNIPEAPRQIPGSASTRGLLLQSNLSVGIASASNVLAGATPIAFSGDYTLSFDVYMSVAIPIPSGSTEQMLWGVGVDGNDTVEARNTRAAGAAGTWGWLANENGYGTEDAAIFEDGTELADLGDTQLGESDPFNAAFTNNIGGPNNVPVNSWVRTDIVVSGGNVSVLYNGVEFFSEMSSSTDGFAMLGYEDPFSSVSSSPDFQWGLFDNFVVTPTPSTLAPAMLVSIGLLRRRRTQ